MAGGDLTTSLADTTHLESNQYVENVDQPLIDEGVTNIMEAKAMQESHPAYAKAQYVSCLEMYAKQYPERSETGRMNDCLEMYPY